jgi:hypothetical protein
MPASDYRRAELEIAIRKQFAAHSHRIPVECRRCAAAVDAILAAADRYARALAVERIVQAVAPRLRPSISPAPDPPVQLGGPS